MINTKKNSLFIVVALVSISFFSACHKDSVTPSVYATINDSAFAAVGANVLSSGGSGAMTTVTANNMPVPGNPNSTTITIYVKNTAGTYNFDPTDNNNDVKIVLVSGATKNFPRIATAGQVKITNSSAHLIQGTFNFTCTDISGTISGNGQFTGTF